MSGRFYFNQNYDFNQINKSSDKYFGNNDLNIPNYNYNYNNNHSNKNYNNNHSYQQNYINNNYNELNNQNIKMSKTPKEKTIQKDMNLINKYSIQNPYAKENNNLNQYNNVGYNYGNNKHYSQENNNNDYRIRNWDINRININNKDDTDYQYSEQNKYNELILKILIYIYYYEKAFSEKKIVNNNVEKYYLINHIWLDKFKNFYSYNNIKKHLQSIKNCNYYLIDIHINDIIKQILESTKLAYQSLPNNFKTNILSNQKGIIIPQKIMNLIQELDKDSIRIGKPNRFFINYNHNSIYYINDKTISFGYFQKSAIFESIYIFKYISNEIEKKEEEKIFYSQINNYIREKNCNTQDFKQILRNGEETIGTLIIPKMQGQQRVGTNIQSANSQKHHFDLSNNNNNINNINKANNIRNNNSVEINKLINQREINKQNITNTNNFLQQEKFNVNNKDDNKIRENKMISDITNPKNNIDEGKELLKAFIYIYYYEKALEEKNIFLNNEDYYLINNEW